jgi:hypothetical protein
MVVPPTGKRTRRTMLPISQSQHPVLDPGGHPNFNSLHGFDTPTLIPQFPRISLPGNNLRGQKNL